MRKIYRNFGSEIIRKCFFVGMLFSSCFLQAEGENENKTVHHFSDLDATVETYYEIPYKQNDDEQTAYHDDSNDLNQKKNLYRLQIGDQLLVSLYGYSDGETSREVSVEPTGNITYLFVGSIPAVGKTIDQLRTDLQEKVKEHYPMVLVAVSSMNLIGDRYTIMGEVNTPGSKDLYGNMTLLQAIAQSGGFPLRGYRDKMIDYADFDHAFLARQGDYIPVDFKRLFKCGDLRQDVLLESGDYIYIPSLLSKEVFVLGEVGQSSIYSYMETASLAEVIAWSGGTTLDANNRVVVIRGSLNCPTQYIIDFDKIRRGCCRDFLLQPGDIVYVPPMRFLAARDLLRGAIRTFVGAITITAGERAFEEIHPHARGDRRDTFFLNPGTVNLTP